MTLRRLERREREHIAHTWKHRRRPPLSAGLIVKPEQQEISRAIRTLLADNSLRERLKQGCARVLARLDWETLTSEMERCYESVTLPTESIR